MDDIFIPDLNFTNRTLSHVQEITNVTLTSFYLVTITGISLIFFLFERNKNSKSKILNLKKIFTKSNLNENNICPICLENNNNLSKTLKCKHKFHEQCIKQWMLNKFECPLCRMNYSYCLEIV